MLESQRLGKLNWLCRRGMKELDLILEAFVNDQSKNLVGGGWPELEQFLATEDDQLWDWIQNPGVAPTRFQPLLAAMRRRE